MLKVNAECSKKFFQDACIVTCREGGQLIGEAEIKCEYTGQWSSFPHCACPIPIPSNDLILKNCSTKIPARIVLLNAKKTSSLSEMPLFCVKKIRNGASCPNVSPRYVHHPLYPNT
ncbi:hypothetical protein TNCT_411451 [Trichonephila clavata]|uniref:Sushi domain-containing protein n=1 Tax=Trichonephila clavata TaxID=2740835 RepID=A0A8X6LFN8_TRICU|nr:hypothetical protein TNCT_411451 [Trichonephila clavata]